LSMWRRFLDENRVFGLMHELSSMNTITSKAYYLQIRFPL
jgi:hypothetical protein